MRYKKIPNTDMNISSITVGTWAIGADGWGDVNTKDSIEAIHAMVDNGVNFIDTAPIYGLDVYKRQLIIILMPIRRILEKTLTRHPNRRFLSKLFNFK